MRGATMSSAATQHLEAVLVEANTLGTASLRERLAWIERAADAVDACIATGDLDDDDARHGALHLRAALGAIVQWSQGDKHPDSLVGLDATVRTLLIRGQLGLLRSLAAFYDDLVTAKAPHRAACVEARDALRDLARAVERGEPPPPSVQARLARVRDALP